MDTSPAQNQREPERYGFRPYKVEEFANRAEELNLIEKRVRAIQREEVVSTPILNFYGVIGLGKSWLVNEILSIYKKDKGSVSALVDFSSDPKPGCLQPGFDVLAALVESMAEQMASRGGELHREWEALRQAISGDERRPEVVETFVDFIRRLTDHVSPVLIFDTTEQAGDDLFYWLEEQVIERVVRSDKVVAIFAGRDRLRWKKFEVRRRVEAVELQPFNWQQTQEQLQKIQQESLDRRRIYEQLKAYPEDVLEAILRFSAGHPLTSREVLEELIDIGQQQEKEIIDKDTLKEILRRINGTVDRIIDGVILKEVKATDLKTYLDNVCILRKFNASPLRFFLTRFEDESYETKADRFYLDLIAKMVETTLVRWSSAHRGYILDPTVRKMMANVLRENETGEYIKRHNTAIELYDDWIKNFPESATSFIIEKLFHLASVTLVQGQEKELGGKLQEELKKVLKEDSLDIDEVLSLYEELRGDEELRELIGGKIFTSLVNQVDIFSGKLESIGG